MMAKFTPQTFRHSRVPSSMSLPRLTSNSVGCCVPQLNGGYLRPRPHPPLSYFSSIYFDDRTDDTAHPHVFCLSRVSSLTPPSSLMPILFNCCVLICKTAATFKAQAPPPPSIFRSLSFCPPQRSNRQHRPNPDGSRPAHGVGERRRRDWMAPLLYPWRERREKPMGVGWRRLELVVVCCVVCWCFSLFLYTGCTLWYTPTTMTPTTL